MNVNDFYVVIASHCYHIKMCLCLTLPYLINELHTISILIRDLVCLSVTISPYSLCSRGRTPAGIDVLGSYLGAVPPLPSLILTHSPSEEEIYQYPPRYPIAAPSVLQWLQRVEGGSESPAGKDTALEEQIMMDGLTI